MKKYLEIITIKGEKVFKRFNITGRSKEQIDEIVEKKSKKLPKTRFIRIIDSPEELEAQEIK